MASHGPTQTGRSPSLGSERATGVGPANPQSLAGPSSLVVLAEPPDAPEGNLDADAHNHQRAFFPDHGAFSTSASGFGWRGGGGLA